MERYIYIYICILYIPYHPTFVSSSLSSVLVIRYRSAQSLSLVDNHMITIVITMAI